MLMNYVELLPGKPTKMHFSDKYKITREIEDKALGRLKELDSLTFWVDELDGKPAARTFSIVSKNLASLLEPYLAEGAYKSYDFIITKTGSGYATSFKVEAVPRF